MRKKVQKRQNKTKIWVYVLDHAKPKSESKREKSPRRGERIKFPWPYLFFRGCHIAHLEKIHKVEPGNQVNSSLSTAQCSVCYYGDRVGSDAARG